MRGDQQFSFKHDLIRDAAYATLPRQQRRQRHAQVAAFLEETTAEIPAASALAQHWRGAGEDGRAADYFVLAGDQAGRGWAKDEAAGFYRRALELLPEEQRDRRREVTRRQAVAMQATFHLKEMLAGQGAGRRGDPSSVENRPG